jgi:putative ABC transport system permease protein
MKNVLKLAWRNVWRNKRRTMFTLMALVFGVMMVVFGRAYMGGIMNSSADAMIKTQAGHVKIAHEEYLRLARIMPKEYLVNDVDRLRPEIENLPGVEMLDMRIRFNVLLSHGEKNEAATAVGAVPETLDKTMDVSGYIVEGRYFVHNNETQNNETQNNETQNGNELVIGSSLAKKLKVSVGQELLLVTTDINYSTYALPFKVIGIFKTGFSSMDKHLLYIPIQKAREMLDCGDSAHELLVFIDDPKNAPELGKQIKALLVKNSTEKGLKVIPWQEDDFISSMLPYVEEMYSKITMIILFVVALVILNTMLMTVMERYREIGVFKALGLTNREVFAMVITESLYLGFIGSVIGGILGSGFAIWLQEVGMNVTEMFGKEVMEQIDIPAPIFGNVVYGDFTIEILITSILFGIVTALVAVLYPAYKSVKMSPVEAFHSELKV